MHPKIQSEPANAGDSPQSTRRCRPLRGLIVE